MNDRYIDYGESSNFPEEAFDMTFNVDGPIEFNDKWLEKADNDDQRSALVEWFTARYCDPAEETPYNGREGGYLFIHGGPFYPDDELRERFSGIVPDEIIDDAITELENLVGSEWAPIVNGFNDEDEFDYYFERTIGSRNEPIMHYELKTSEVAVLILQNNNIINQQLILQMSYGMLISATEAYISDSVIYWAKKDEKTLFRLASKECKERDYKLSEVLNDIDKFKEKFILHLTGNVVWHRLDKLKSMIEHGLQIKLPEIGKLLGAVQTRHDIVHRAGKTKNGEEVILTKDELEQLRKDLDDFVDDFESKIKESYPINVFPRENH
ncbi:hypothetical protein ABNP39_07990 [Pantoea dispersa]|uniref:hypothetical protein n=1 Tax=Pantoea dispersa TaxID=59814 RepID=UPI0032ED77A2